MIYLSNGRVLDHVIAAGAMGFDGEGWWWEKPLVRLGLIKRELFTTFIRTLTKNSRPYPVSNLSWIRPWTWLPFSPYSCIRTIEGGAANKLNLWNRGFNHWCCVIAPRMDFAKHQIGGSIYGEPDEVEEMARRMNDYGLTALEVNLSCPNTGHRSNTYTILKGLERAKKVCRHPLVAKLSEAHDCIAISRGAYGMAEAISLNSVRWEVVFPGKKSPLSGIGGTAAGGGVSGKPAQEKNWQLVAELAQGKIPVIAPGIMEYKDIAEVHRRGACAVSYGCIHLPTHPVWKYPWTMFTNPCKPTQFAQRDFAERKKIT